MSSAIVMVVDDSLLARRMIAHFVQKMRPEWQVVEAENAEEALARDEVRQAMLFTIDLNMPGMDGIEFAAKVREVNTTAKLNLVTANIQDAVRRRAESIGCAFITKPITEDKIAQALEGLD